MVEMITWYEIEEQVEAHKYYMSELSRLIKLRAYDLVAIFRSQVTEAAINWTYKNVFRTVWDEIHCVADVLEKEHQNNIQPVWPYQ